MATENFAPNTLIIPMEEAYQNNGMWLAYGLVYRLLLNGIPVKWAIQPGKAYNGTDFIASAQDLQSGSPISSHAYTGGPFIIDSAFYTQALPIVTAWQAANPNTKVHRATAAFTAPIASTMSRAPRIAIEDNNSSIMIGYLNAAKIPDSNGNTWSSASPGVLTNTEVTNGAFFGFNKTDPCRKLVFDIYLSPHTSDGDWTPTNCAELNLFLRTGGFLHATCHSIGSIENICGPFLTTSGFTSFGNKGDDGTFTVDVPDYPSAQAVPTSGKVQKLPGGSEQSWLHTSVTYRPSTQVLAHFLDNGTQYDFMVGGSYKGGTGAGKIVYEGGHQYSTSIPYSNNEDGPYLRFVLDSVFFSVTKPNIVLNAVPRNIPSGVASTVTFLLVNTGGGVATGASASVTLAPWAIYNLDATIAPSSIVGQTLNWNATALAGNTGPGTILSFTAQVTPPATGEQSAATYTSSYGDEFDETYSINYCASVNATPGAAPSVVKTPLNQAVNPNDPISWTITAANNGTLALNNVVITDTLPAGLTFSSAVPAASSVVPGPGGTTIITWQSPQIAASIAPLGSINITLNATAPAATTAVYTNQVNLTGTDTTPANYSVDNTAKVNVNNQTPTVTLISPNGGELICNPVNITWTASDPDGDPITYTLEYSADGGSTFTTIATGLPGTCPSPGPPYCTYLWDTNALPSGTNYIVRVSATDGELTGQDVSDAPFTIDNTAPTVNWVFPTNGAFLSTTPVVLEASATDNVGVISVQFLYSTDGFITSTVIGTDLTPVGNIYSTNWELSGLPAGPYQLRAVATDQCNKSAQKTISVSVDLPPEVVLLSPNGGATICPPGTTITWTAEDPNPGSLTYTLSYSDDGGISYTEIVSGLTGTCPPPGPPVCSYVWDTTGLPSGSNYLVKVEASDGILTSEDVSDAPFTIDNSPPTVNWVSPANGSLITSSPVLLQATATDNVAVTGVTFQYSTDGGITYTDLGTDLTPGPGNTYSFSWNFAPLAPGAYKLRAVATDGCNNSANSNVVNVTLDLPPTVVVVSPNGGEIICSPGTTITWSATDPNGENTLTYSVLYSSNGGTTYNLLASGLTGVCPPPNQCTYIWDTTALPSGNNYLVKVVVSDGILTAEDVSDAPFTIDNTPPTVTWIAPANGSFLFGTVTLEATATDNVGVTGVTFEYSNDGGATFNLIANVPTPFEDVYATPWNTTLLPSGSYILRATASDQCQNTTEALRNVRLDSTPPTVAIPSPPDGSEVSGTVPILVEAQDNECLAKVELYIDGLLVHTEIIEGGAKTSEFIFDWDTAQVSEGPHIVKAIATDCAGFTAETENTYIVNNLPEHYTQLLIDGTLTIPTQKPDVEKITEVTVTSRVTHVETFNTIDGTKVIVKGFIDIGITYSATDDQQKVHYAHFTKTFVAMILWPELPLDTELCPVIIVEHEQHHLLDPRTIKKDIVLFVGVKRCN